MMLQINLCSTLILAIILIVSGEVWPFLEFVGRYPYVIYNIIQLSAGWPTANFENQDISQKIW